MDFKSTYDLLSYLWIQHSQAFADIDCNFKWDIGLGHIEFYQFGPDLIATPIYRKIQRIELLTVGVDFTEGYVDTCVKEMVSMINRKAGRPGTRIRRIKLQA